MATEFTIPAVWLLDADQGEELEVEITYEVSWAEPAVFYGDAPYPGCLTAVSFISAKANMLDAGAFNGLRDESLAHWAELWLDEHDGDATDHAAQQLERESA